MKKLFPHVIYIVIIVFFIVYANIKAREAEKQTQLAFAQSESAQKNAEDAKKQAMIAQEQAAIARMQERKAVEAYEELEACKSKK